MGPIESRLHSKLNERFKPFHIELKNESPMHGLNESAEKHFRVVIVSDDFEGLSRIERHRLVYEIVEHELKTHVHALSVQGYTIQEWAKKKGETFDSPECLGGGKREGIR